MAKKRNYVNNKDLLQALIVYREMCAEAEEAGEKRPRIPDYIGKCIFMMANRLATRPNFSGYSYKEDMISDGIEFISEFEEKNIKKKVPKVETPTETTEE